jgi:hypothetical protein
MHVLIILCFLVFEINRNRDDTVRSIVTSVTEDGSGELSDELIKGQPLVLDESYHSDDDNENWESWQPGPVDADCCEHRILYKYSVLTPTYFASTCT